MFSWAAFRLLASGLFQRLLKAVSAALEWLLSDWRNAPLTMFGFAVFWVSFVTFPALRDDVALQAARADAAEAERTATLDAFEQTVANYLAAAAAAQAAAEANVARVAAEQATINQETIDVYQSRLDAARARHAELSDELRRASLRTAVSDPGRSGAAGVPGPGAASGAAAQAPAGPRLPACPPALVCLTIDEALIATEQALQLDALIDWTIRQSRVPFLPGETQNDER